MTHPPSTTSMPFNGGNSGFESWSSKDEVIRTYDLNINGAVLVPEDEIQSCPMQAGKQRNKRGLQSSTLSLEHTHTSSKRKPGISWRSYPSWVLSYTYLMGKSVMVYNQLLVSFKSKVKFLHKITTSGVLLFCGTKSLRKSDALSGCSRHTARQILVSLPQVEPGKSPKS